MNGDLAAGRMRAAKPDVPIALVRAMSACLGVLSKALIALYPNPSQSPISWKKSIIC
jgi:hypothetical protein